MSTLYIRFPSKAAIENASPEAAPECHFALATDSGAVEREGTAVLEQLGEAISAAQKVVVLLAASDVNLLQVQVPPLSASRLKAALPNLVEEQLMTDPAECILAAGPAMSEGLRTIAVVNRTWLENAVQRVLALGARSVAVLPLQLCLPYQPDTVAATFAESGASLDVDLALRTGEQEGIGLALLPAQPEAAAREALQTLCALVPHQPIALYVQQARLPAWQAAAEALGQEERIALFADNWPRWIAGVRGLPFNLAAGLGGGGGPSLNLRAWRWPLVLAGLLLLVNIGVLNFQWLRLKGEAGELRAAMTQTFKSVYPKEPLTGDPVLQMRRNIDLARQRAGQAAPDDFLVLASAFGEAWQGAMQGRTGPGIATVEYNERTLQVTLKPEGEAPTAQIQAALAARNLSLTPKTANVWQIRSSK
ncbi:type II secretion system protein GspL [Janthinobacterium sp. 17J80-10]|uniref:type II secretion system protein GspL n=1 Tax=Janthinobacterium sp. 17J80-10 TaxID=2497863 RepID=UPI001005A4A4|nr:type II secretion system protein GspL [Janthinobacterium sp. 17J80-10]QAU33280.1 general secretion pathway protein GspL [Janthinobacterium sp. 17J80-10]